jgi:DNA transposition AAA+ family ATPase
LEATVEAKPATTKSVPRLSPFFVERDDIFQFMEQRLIQDPCGTQRLFVIYGMGGSGKTQTASFFARRNKNQ